MERPSRSHISLPRLSPNPGHTGFEAGSRGSSCVSPGLSVRGRGSVRTPQLPCSAMPAAGHSGGEWESGAPRPGGQQLRTSGPQQSRVALRVTFRRAGDQTPAQDIMLSWRVSPAPAGSQSRAVPTRLPRKHLSPGLHGPGSGCSEATSSLTSKDCRDPTPTVVHSRMAWSCPTSKEIV